MPGFLSEDGDRFRILSAAGIPRPGCGPRYGRNVAPAPGTEKQRLAGGRGKWLQGIFRVGVQNPGKSSLSITISYRCRPEFPDASPVLPGNPAPAAVRRRRPRDPVRFRSWRRRGRMSSASVSRPGLPPIGHAARPQPGISAIAQSGGFVRAPRNHPRRCVSRHRERGRH